ncbi:hypothetical protein E2C06_17900 [Dankookia rubra]|uniref:CagE TrbE VirB component of type IV transporter system central domain-containing protein n=1 Tax=Dankookia rubra TaxID=1442381 RepID=A0A4R5QDK2_9PROT|nr:hypothetical protein [Dankookia rubra]TDH61244.1 hypothetical protein E2C06_17900 [Dankookia rubra]
MRRYVRSSAEAFSDLYRWATLADSGLVVTRGGEILVGYWQRPPDTASSAKEIRAAISGRTNAALQRFGTDWSLWSDVAVVPVTTYPAPHLSAFPDPLSRAIDEERRQMFRTPGRFFHSGRALVWCYSPPPAAARRLADAMYRDDRPQDRRTPFALAVETVTKAMNEFEDTVGPLLGLQRMVTYTRPDTSGVEHAYDELVNYLAFTAYGVPFELQLPDDGAFLDAVIGGEDFTPGHTPLLGQEYVASIALEAFPAQSTPGIIDGLAALGMPYRLSQRFIFRDTADAERDIKDAERDWVSLQQNAILRALGFKNLPTNQYAVEMAQSCREAQAIARENRVKFGFYNATLVLRHENPAELAAMIRVARKAIHEAGFKTRLEEENGTEAFVATLPGNAEANVRRPMLHTANLADLITPTGIWTGEPENPNHLYPRPAPALMQAVTTGGEPYWYNNCVGENGNFLFLGVPGAGKTTLMNATALQALRYRGAKVRGIDYKRGMKTTALSVGGRHYELGADGGPAFAPLAHLETDAEMLAAQEWVETCFALIKHKTPDDGERGAIREALIGLQHQPGRRSVTNFCVAVQSQSVRRAMEFYCLDKGAGGFLFDAADLGVSETHFDVFDITRLMAMGDAILLPALLSLFARFDRGLDGRPQFWLLDEVWVALKSPVWAPRLYRDLKTRRSYAVSVGLATQNIADFAASDLLPVILENVPTRVCGANPEAQTGDIDAKNSPAGLYAALGYGWQQRELIRTLEAKREYFVTQPAGSRVIRPEFGPLMLSVAGTTGETEIRQVEALIAQHGADWLRHHLASKGLDYHALVG